MKRTLKILKWIGLIFLGLILISTIGGAIFMYAAPQFGQKPEGEDLERISQSANFKDNEFINLIETSQGEFGEVLGTLPDFFTLENGTPEAQLPVKYGLNQSPTEDSMTFVTWYGHSSVLMEMEGKRILIDPVLSKYASPMSFGASRFPNEQEIPIDKLTDIDIVIISHDHYDHLDYETIIELDDQVKHYYTALGVGSHLKSWGIAVERITELDWW